MINLKPQKGQLTVAQKMAKGDPGGYYTPKVDKEGNLSWLASEDDMANVATTNIAGPPGRDGEITFSEADKEELVQMVLDSLPKAEEVEF